MVTATFRFFDLNSFSGYDVPFKQGAHHEYRQNDFFSTHGLHAMVRISKMCRTIFGQLQKQNVFLPRSIPLHGLCSINIPRKFARYRSLFTIHEQQTLSHGYSRQSQSNDSGQSQRESRLAYLCRFCANLNSFCQGLVFKRRLWFRSQRNGLCFRRYDHRFMFISVSVGQIPNDQSRNQNAYASGFTRTHPSFRRDYASKSSRCQYFRYPYSRAGFLLHHGSWLHRLRKTLSTPSILCVLYHSCQRQLKRRQNLFTPHRQINWPQIRSNNPFEKLLFRKRLSRTFKACSFFRFRARSALCLLNKQFFPSGINHCASLQRTLEDRALF